MDESNIGAISFLVMFFLCGLPAILGALALPFVVTIWYLRRQSGLLEDLKRTGQPGRATILEIQPTGTTIFPGQHGREGIPRWNVRMEVRVPGYPAFQLTKTFTLSREQADRLSPGTEIDVLADPDAPHKTGIVWDPALLENLPRRQA